VLDILVQSRRDKRAAKKFFRKLLKGLKYVPRVIVTDKLDGATRLVNKTRLPAASDAQRALLGIG